jgi:hypothetical protein
LALVHRYMINAEEAEAATERVAARAREDTSSLTAREQPQPETVEQKHAGLANVGYEAEVPLVEATTTRPVPDASRRVSPEARRNGVPGVVDQADAASNQMDPREEARARKRHVKADKSAARKAARELAALEKKEARERKALARAAARRH